MHVSDRLRQNFTLQVGDSRGLVTVIADPESVQLGSAEVRDVMERLQVSELPLKGRQFLDLAMLSPGVVRPPGGTRGDAMQQARSYSVARKCTTFSITRTSTSGIERHSVQTSETFSSTQDSRQFQVALKLRF